MVKKLMNLFYVHTYIRFSGGGDVIYVEMGDMCKIRKPMT